MQWKVSKKQSGLPLSHYIQEQLKEKPSIKQIKRSLEKNSCTLNGTIERFGSRRVREGDAITYTSKVEEKQHEVEEERILYEDDELLLYNKPSGTSCERVGMPALFPHFHQVHRLDKETSGVLLFAKTGEAKRELMKRFKHRKVHKEYLALVDGIPSKKGGVIQNQLGKVGWFQGQTVWGEVERGLFAETKWKVEASGKTATLLRCFPKTGRTHQIRVHLKEMGHPILGDAQYCRTFKCPYTPARHLLHARKIRFDHPKTGKCISVSAPLPEDFQNALLNLSIRCAF